MGERKDKQSLEHRVHQSLIDLLDYTRNQLKTGDIEAWLNSDPGTGEREKLWNKIADGEGFAHRSFIDFSEDMMSAIRQVENDLGLVRGRRFMLAVHLVFIYEEVDADISLGIAEPVGVLIGDIDPTDKVHASLVADALLALHDKWQGKEIDYPFLTLGQLVIAGVLGNTEKCELLATRLRQEDKDYRWNEKFFDWVMNDQFVYGLTEYNSSTHAWRKVIKTLKNPNCHSDLAYVIEQLS